MQGWGTNNNQAPLFQDLQVAAGAGSQAINNTTSPSDWSWFGGKDVAGDATNSYLGTGLSVAQGALGAWMGMKQLELGQDSLSMQKDQFNKNFTMQQDSYNRQLADQATARASSSYVPMKF